MQWLKIFFLFFFTPLLFAEKPSFASEKQETVDLNILSHEKEGKSDSSDDSGMCKVTQSYEATLFKTLGSLIGLLALVILTIWMLRKTGRGQFIYANASKSIKILEKRPLSSKSILYLVEVNKKQMLIAESQMQVRSLMSIYSFPENGEL